MVDAAPSTVQCASILQMLSYECQGCHQSAVCTYVKKIIIKQILCNDGLTVSTVNEKIQFQPWIICTDTCIRMK